VTRICIISSHRAERGLLQPLIDRLEAHPEFALDLFSLTPAGDFVANYIGARNRLELSPSDVVLIPCDRTEALAGATAAFNLGIPIIHFHAGDTGTVSKDETHRATISLMASVHLCNGPTAMKVVIDLLTAINRSTGHVHDVGSTVLDGANPDVSMCPDDPFDLVLYHPSKDDPEVIEREIDEIEKILATNIVYADGSASDVSQRQVFWGYPNGDPGSPVIIKRMHETQKIGKRPVTLFSASRDRFLGLMMRCERFIGNSSSMVCEAPAWLREEQIIHIGDRNRSRSFDGIQIGGTDRIIKILEAIDWKVDFKTGVHPK
jgi:UDP-N-acetylglucosamine 2-epimerase